MLIVSPVTAGFCAVNQGTVRRMPGKGEAARAGKEASRLRVVQVIDGSRVLGRAGQIASKDLKPALLREQTLVGDLKVHLLAVAQVSDRKDGSDGRSR